MRYLRVAAGVAGFMLSLASLLPAQLTKELVPGEVRTFEIVAEDYKFSPFNIIVNQGDKVQFVVTAGDRDYEFKLKAYDIKERVRQGVPATINFTATKAGTFTFTSPGLVHRSMKGTLVVRGLVTKSKKKKEA